MNQPFNFIQQHIRDLPPYKPILPFDVLSDELGIPKENLLKLDANENPFGPLPEVSEVLSRIRTLHIYPDPESRQIKRLLASHHKIPEESIVMGAGADELIDLIMRIVLAPGEKFINCPPTFGMYAFDGALNHAEVITVPRNSDFSLDMDMLLSAVKKHKPKILFLANPNNPDGGILLADEFRQLVELPLLLVMDEAYIQFSDKGASYIQEVGNHSNLIVLQTFSKWAGLAGLRIGFGVFPKPLAPILMKAKQPYNVSVAAERAAVVSMLNLSIAEKRIAEIIRQRNKLVMDLGQIPWLKPTPSQANFILCRVAQGSAFDVQQRLRRQGILIRYFDKPGLSDHIRISIGTAEQNQILLSALEGIGEL